MKKSLLVILSLCFLLQGCAALVVAGAAGAVSTAHDRRSLGAQIEDSEIEFKLNNALGESPELYKIVNVAFISFNRNVLIVGQAPSRHLSLQVEQLVHNNRNVRNVFNQIRIGKPVGLEVHADDAWISTKVKKQLLTAEKLDGSHVKVYTENNEVFLMGLVNDSEAQQAIEVARNVRGVIKVIDVFERVKTQ
ncbi:BON domain-containing protein [Saccharobesus litoralis]|uniref:BON domain-containing protein n=1 Tax=Saccharobesus litoralis TaxID=2172099 RepID=A0A2S0VQ01_9ALTE|nr:BON domain-containing protein [Saccharobesus litoralis]AWB66279.1 BON domain-containing protein [Saccharobesus litoralis]